MLALVTVGTQVKTREHWFPPRRLNKLPCELCGLMAQHATWSVSGDGESRYAFMHVHCSYCFEHTNWGSAHAMRIEAYEQRKGASRGQEQPKLAKVVGL